MWHILAIFFPGLIPLLRGNGRLGLVLILLQLTGIGWPPAVLIAFGMIINTDRMRASEQHEYQLPSWRTLLADGWQFTKIEEQNMMTYWRRFIQEKGWRQGEQNNLANAVRAVPIHTWIVTGVNAFIIVGCLGGLIYSVQSGTPSTNVPLIAHTPIKTSPKATSTSLAEHLTFTGDISGVLETGENPRPLTHSNPIPDYVQKNGTTFEPAPTWTQCADFDSGFGQDYIAVMVGNIGTMQYAITVEISKDDPAFKNPGTPLKPGNVSSKGGIELYEVSGAERRWRQVYGPSQQEPTIVLNNNRISGTVDTWLATTDQNQKFAQGTLYVQGSWRCG
jgi:hypothetical protein